MAAKVNSNPLTPKLLVIIFCGFLVNTNDLLCEMMTEIPFVPVCR